MGNSSSSLPGLQPGSRDNPLRFGDQDFQAVRTRCLRDERLFEDPCFPAQPESLGPLQDTDTELIEWVRASVLFKPPRFFVNSVDVTDIRQGDLGDCWFLAAMCSLTMDRHLFSYVVPTDQSFQQLYAGIFRFRFWQYGRWVEVVIDDRLPTRHQKLVFTSSSADNELWSALLEKAYAKLNGSYASLRGGHVAEAMEDFTGGIAFFIVVNPSTPDKMWEFLKRALAKETLLSCDMMTSDPKDLEKDNGLGLMYAHAYAILDAETVQLDRSSVKLIQVRNPWGHTEYNGPWSDRSPNWNSVSNEEKARLKLKIKEDGAFWMPPNIFVQNFSRVELCSIDPLCFHNTKCVWGLTSHEGMWMAGISAGGSYGEGTFWTNPQYRLTLLEEDDDSNDDEVSCTVTVELLQKYGRKKDKIKFLGIAFFIFAVPEQFQNQASHFGRNFFRHQKALFSSGNYASRRSVAQQLQIPPGQYVIVPSTKTKKMEGEFFLRIFAKKLNVSRDNSISTSAFHPEIGRTETDAANTVLNLLKDATSLNNTLSVSEFMQIFNSASSPRFHLTLETCCSLVFTLNDLGQHGCLNSHEAEQLVTQVLKLERIFDKFADEGSGLMNSINLRPAFSVAGFNLDSRVLRQLWLRHSTSTSTICFSHFLSCLAKLQKLFGIYGRLRNKRDYSGPENIDEWLLLFIGI